jgi:hypothetical protein
MSVPLGATAPDFEADTTEGRIRFHDWIGDSWAVLFSHPKDFTPVCTTELGYMAKIKPAFELRNVKVMGLSVDSAGDHEAWAKDIEETQGYALRLRRRGAAAIPGRPEGAAALHPHRPATGCVKPGPFGPMVFNCSERAGVPARRRLEPAPEDHYDRHHPGGHAAAAGAAGARGPAAPGE